uniref:OMP1110 n=1 Tax=Helicobacter salomonis TaxID=56878 RepID=A0A1M4NIJ1_9HELI|nr:OMP1110 [Helicobacter salomonis]
MWRNQFECVAGILCWFYHSRRKAPSFSYGDIRLAPAGLC